MPLHLLCGALLGAQLLRIEPLLVPLHLFRSSLCTLLLLCWAECRRIAIFNCSCSVRVCGRGRFRAGLAGEGWGRGGTWCKLIFQLVQKAHTLLCMDRTCRRRCGRKEHKALMCPVLKIRKGTMVSLGISSRCSDCPLVSGMND